MFVYVYAVAAKNRLDDDDDRFMASLQDSLRAYKKRKAEVAETANTLFTFDNDAGPSSKVEKKDSQKEKSENVKVCDSILSKIAITLNIFDRDPLPFQLNDSLLLLKPLVQKMRPLRIQLCLRENRRIPKPKRRRNRVPGPVPVPFP
jgi:hypothetical protein